METIIALQLQIQVLVTQINSIRAELSPAQVQMIDWTPYEIATRIVPASEENK